MENKYEKMTNEDFDRILMDILEDDVSVGELISIPGIYEVLSLHFNNDVLDLWEKEQDFDD